MYKVIITYHQQEQAAGFTSPSGKTLWIKMKHPSIVNLKDPFVVDIAALMQKARMAVDERLKWRKENAPYEKDMAAWKAYCAREASRYPPGSFTAYVELTYDEMMDIKKASQLCEG